MDTFNRNPHDLIDCIRCGKTEFLGTAEGWNTVFDMGVIVGHICPDCQTTEESIEAEVNSALTDYSSMKAINTVDELLEMSRPQWRKALKMIANGEVDEGNALFHERIEEFRKVWNAMNRYNLDAQLGDYEETYSLLVQLGEFPDF